MSTQSPLVGYGDRLSVRPTDRIRFHVGARAGEVPYRADIVRLRCADLQPGGAEFAEEELASDAARDCVARVQRLDRGSRAIVPESAAFAGLTSFSVQVAIWPTLPGGRRQVIFGTWDELDRTGFALFLDERGAPALLVGDGSGAVVQAASPHPLRERQWVRLSASYDAEVGRVRIVQAPRDDTPTHGLVSPMYTSDTSTARLATATRARRVVIAACTAGSDERGAIYTAHFDGKIEAPRLARGVLGEDELDALAEPTPVPQLAERIIGCWDFSTDFDARRIVDRSSNELHGALENCPTRAVTGFRWSGSEHDWRRAPEQYAAIHFHSDDLYDAGWSHEFALEIPPDWRSGIYAARLRSADAVDYVPFFVCPPRGTNTAELAFLVPTATYLAYANMPDPHAIVAALARGAQEGGPQPDRLEHTMEPPGEYGPSCYHVHSDGSGVHHSSHLRPVSNLEPRHDLWGFNADTLITDWLEASGVTYDVITDELLHAEGRELLERYRVVVTGTHPEYYSTPMLDGLEQYLAEGGRLVYLGGNGFYWRIGFSQAWPGTIEVRRAEDGTRAWESQPGEYHHAWGGELGGLWRRIGRPPNRLVGVGFAAQGFGSACGYAKRPGASDPRAAFIFEGVEASAFGDHGRLGGAACEELDRFDPRLGSPPHALVLASADRFGPDMIKTKEEFLAMVPPDPADPEVRADLVFFETPKGGAVFSTGSIAWAGSLAHAGYRNDVSQITENVIRRFLDPMPFEWTT